MCLVMVQRSAPISLSEVRQRFQEKCSGFNVPSCLTIHNFVSKFWDTGSVTNKKMQKVAYCGHEGKFGLHWDIAWKILRKIALLSFIGNGSSNSFLILKSK